MPIRAYLYDAEGTDRQVDLDKSLIDNLTEQQLLWVDLDAYQEEEVQQTATLFGWNRASVYGLSHPNRRPRLDTFGSYFQLNVDAIRTEGQGYTLTELDFVVGPNYVVTAHKEPVDVMQSFDRRVRDDSQLGQLDSAAFLAALLDWHINAYFRIVETLQSEIDKLDERVLRLHPDDDLLTDLVAMRRRIGRVRRALTPHRKVFFSLARPDFQALANTTSAAHFLALNDRMERAIDAVENARDLLIGSFDIFTTQTTLRTNEIIKTLTLVTVSLLPAGAIASLMGMNFKTALFNTGEVGFWSVIAAILVISTTTVLFARWKRWL